MGKTVVIENRQRTLEINPSLEKKLEAVALAALLEEKLGFPSEISLAFVSERVIKELNAEHRLKNAVTDVLSFPMVDVKAGIEKTDWFDGRVILGDVIICPIRAFSQAKEYGHSNEREICYLFLHGCLHLLGHDHMEEKDKKLMREKEEKILEALKIFR